MLEMANVLEKVPVVLGIPITLINFKKGLMHLKTRIIFFCLSSYFYILIWEIDIEKYA